MKKYYFTLIFVLILSIFTIAASAATGSSLIGDNVLASKTEFLKYFNDNPNISISDYEGIKSLFMDEIDTGSYTVLTKQRIELDEYTYTVTVAGLGSSTRTTCEIPIVIGSDEQNSNSKQIYIIKRSSSIVIRHARKVAGVFTNTFESELDYIMDDDTFFTFVIQVSGHDANIYLNNEYVATITEDTGFKGYAGIRCTNPLIVKELLLQEGIVEVEEPTPTATPELTATPESTQNPANNTEAPKVTATAAKTPEKTEAADESGKEGFSPAVTGGIIAVVVIAACVVAVLIMGKTKKRK